MVMQEPQSSPALAQRGMRSLSGHSTASAIRCSQWELICPTALVAALELRNRNLARPSIARSQYLRQGFDSEIGEMPQ